MWSIWKLVAVLELCGQLVSAIFEWTEAWYNPHRRHSSIDNLSPIAYERLYTTAVVAA